MPARQAPVPKPSVHGQVVSIHTIDAHSPNPRAERSDHTTNGLPVTGPTYSDLLNIQFWVSGVIIQ